MMVKDSSRRYSLQEEIRAYYEQVAQHRHLDQSTCFNATVLTARWDDRALAYRITVCMPAGTAAHYTACVLISCIGHLNRPKCAAIQGPIPSPDPQFPFGSIRGGW